MLSRIATTRSIRQSSTLAEKLRLAGSGESQKRQTIDKSTGTEVDESGEAFREFYVMPKRKLRGQMQIEHVTGRTAWVTRSRGDIHDRLSVRKERSREMDPDQEWSDVWPAARTFNASVVPLPVRMGTRPDPDKRAPFKKQGNLELVKIPNFLHLTPAAIQKHCEAIKKFCTEFPAELVGNDQLMKEEFPLSISYCSYVHQGTNIRDNRARIVTVTVPVSALNLTSEAKEKLIRLVGDRYDEASDLLTIITDRCHTRKQNLDYANYLLTVLYHESNKQESWETLKEREDHLKVEFDGSKCKEQLINTLKHSIQHDQLDSPLKSLGDDVDAEKIAEHPSVRQFATMWNEYRNKEETPASTREYARQVRELLGLKTTEPTARQ